MAAGPLKALPLYAHGGDGPWLSMRGQRATEKIKTQICIFLVTLQM